jgi:hypothetical protein
LMSCSTLLLAISTPLTVTATLPVTNAAMAFGSDFSAPDSSGFSDRQPGERTARNTAAQTNILNPSMQIRIIHILSQKKQNLKIQNRKSNCSPSIEV